MQFSMNAPTRILLEFFALMRPISLSFSNQQEAMQKKLEVVLKALSQNRAPQIFQKKDHLLAVHVKKFETTGDEVPNPVKKIFEQKTNLPLQELPRHRTKISQRLLAPSIFFEGKASSSIKLKAIERRLAFFQKMFSETKKEERFLPKAPAFSEKLMTVQPHQLTTVLFKTLPASSFRRIDVSVFSKNSPRMRAVVKSEVKTSAKAASGGKVSEDLSTKERVFVKREVKRQAKMMLFDKPKEQMHFSFLKPIRPFIPVFFKELPRTSYPVLQMNSFPRTTLIEIPKVHRIEMHSPAFAIPFFVPGPSFSLFKKKEKMKEHQDCEGEEDESDLDS